MSLYVERLWRDHAGFDLTAQQLGMIEAVLGGVASGKKAVIEGPAGTGKSTVMSALIVEATRRHLAVAVAAPTHKAAKVLTKLLAKWESTLGTALPEPVTIHSLLKLVPVKGRPGQPDKLRQKRTSDLRAYDLLIVDECSMIGQELFPFIMEAADRDNVALLFTGDSCQLQPVNEYRQSPCFSTGTRHVLTEVLRHDGAVLKLATRARKLKQPQVHADSDGSTEVCTYASQEDLREAWLEAVKKAHDLGVAPELSPVMLCWTNENRRNFNKKARQHIYGDLVPDFMEGDLLVTLNSYVSGDSVIIHNNVDLRVGSAKFISGYSPLDDSNYVYDCWEIQLRNSALVYVLADHDRLNYKRDLRELGKEIKTELQAAEAKVKTLINKLGKGLELLEARDIRDAIHSRWQNEYFRLKEAFIDVDFNYACTIHKSQGSTYQDVYIWDDYTSSPERKELLYVAVTRASKSVHHLHVGLQRAAA